MAAEANVKALAKLLCEEGVICHIPEAVAEALAARGVLVVSDKEALTRDELCRVVASGCDSMGVYPSGVDGHSRVVLCRAAGMKEE